VYEIIGIDWSFRIDLNSVGSLVDTRLGFPLASHTVDHHFIYLYIRITLHFKTYYLDKPHSTYSKKFSETDIFKMLELLINNIFECFGGRVFQRTIGILIENQLCSSDRLADLFVIRMRQTSYQGFSGKTES
jgi:hypothetical protein